MTRSAMTWATALVEVARRLSPACVPAIPCAAGVTSSSLSCRDCTFPAATLVPRRSSRHPPAGPHCRPLLQVTISIGIAVHDANAADDATELMKKADIAMYGAKQAAQRLPGVRRSER